MAGGRTTTSTTSRDPPKRVTFGRVTVVQDCGQPGGDDRVALGAVGDVLDRERERRGRTRTDDHLVLGEPHLCRHVARRYPPGPPAGGPPACAAMFGRPGWPRTMPTWLCTANPPTSRCSGRAGCGAPLPCATSSPRPTWRPPTSSHRCSCARASTSRSRSARCPACPGHPREPPQGGRRAGRPGRARP